MSTEKLNAYLNAYSRLLNEIIELHNLHINYLKHEGRTTGSILRRQFKKIAKLQKELQKKNLAAYNESRQNTKNRLAKQREERAYRRANPLKKGRKKKNEQHNNTNANTI